MYIYMYVYCICVGVYICKMESYLSMKKKEMLPFVIMWMTLESIMLSKVSQTKKDK